MGAMQSAQAASSYLEKLRDKVPLLYERDDILLTMIQKNGDVEVVSPRSMRISLQLRPGGKARQVNFDGGDLGRGSGTVRDQALVSPIDFAFAVEVNKLVEYATSNAKKAVENVAKKEVKNGLAQFRMFLDALMQTDGTGTLGVISVVNGNTLTLTAPYYTALLYFNQGLQVYDTTLTISRGLCNITQIDPVATTIQVDQVPPNTVATDVLLPDSVTGAQPVSLYGLKYHQNGAAVGNWLNLSRATYPEIRTPFFAANSALVTSQVRIAKNAIRKRLGINALKSAKLIAYMAVEQEHAWEQLGITISEIIRSGAGNEEMPDLLFEKKGTMAGLPIHVSIHADPTRIDFVALSNWGRAVTQDIDFYEQGGQTVFPVYGQSGGIQATYLFYYVYMLQVFNQNPRFGAYINGLTIPSGYSQIGF